MINVCWRQSAGAIHISAATRHTVNAATLLQRLHQVHVCPPAPEFGIVRDAEAAITARRVAAKLAAGALAAEYPATDPMTREEYAKTPRIEVEVGCVSAPGQRVLHKHERALDALEAVGRFDEYTGKFRAVRGSR